MAKHPVFFPLVLGFSVLVAQGSAQTERKLTARELFYTPVADVKPQPKPAVPKETTSAGNTRPQNPKPNIPRPKVPKPHVPESGGTVSRPDPKPLEGTYQTVASRPPLALRYSILKNAGDGEYLEVDPEMVFRSGDKIRVGVEANDDAYLYIVQQGSSKTWQLLFPSMDVENGSNQVQKNRQYVIPGGARFSFDEQPGTERLFLVLTRQPESDMEKLIYSLSSDQVRPSSAPASNETKPAAPKTLMAANRPIEDDVISRIRGKVLARDLVFEKVDESKPGPKREKAMYVATEDGGPSAKLIVDLKLIHR